MYAFHIDVFHSFYYFESRQSKITCSANSAYWKKVKLFLNLRGVPSSEEGSSFVHSSRALAGTVNTNRKQHKFTFYETNTYQKLRLTRQSPCARQARVQEDFRPILCHKSHILSQSVVQDCDVIPFSSGRSRNACLSRKRLRPVIPVVTNINYNASSTTKYNCYYCTTI